MKVCYDFDDDLMITSSPGEEGTQIDSSTAAALLAATCR